MNGNLHLEEKDARRREAARNDVVEALKQGEISCFCKIPAV